MLRRAFVIAVSSLVLLSIVPAAASASVTTGPITWGAPAAVDAQLPFGSVLGLFGVSCPSSSQCFALDVTGTILSTTNPAGGRTAWSRVSSTGLGGGRITCGSGPFCLVWQSSNSIAASANPGAPGSWTGESIGARDITGASCASAALCAMVDGSGNVWTSTTPTVAASWTATHVSTQPLNAISCPSVSLCMAAGQTGSVYFSTNPTGGSQAWLSTSIAGNVTAISCSAGGYCWAGDNTGDVLHSNGDLTHPWSTLHVSTQIIASISCSSTACVAITTNDDIIGTSNPTTTSTAADWKAFTADEGQMPSVVCPLAASICVAVDEAGNVLTSSAPGAGDWATELVDATNSLDDVACPSAALCVAADNAGSVLTSTNPSGGPGAWQRTFVSSHRLDAISCPSVSLCVLGDNNGNIVTSTDPAGGAGAFSQPVHLSSQGLFSLSCATASLCVAIDGTDKAYVSTNPTGGAGAWSSVSVDPQQTLVGVSCPTASFCAAVDEHGDVVTSTNPAGGASAWSAPTPADPGQFIDAISCSGRSQCVAVDGAGEVVASNSPATGPWSAPIQLANGTSLEDVTCRPGPMCVTVDSAGNVWVSTDPTGGPGAWAGPANVDGANALDAVRCSPELLCVAVDEFGNLVVGTPAPPVNTAAPTIAGTPVQGVQLAESAGTWNGNPTSFAYQWQDCDLSGSACAAIPGASAQAYVVQASDAGHTIRVQETATNAGGTTAATSLPTAVVAGMPASTGRPTPAGSAQPGINHIRAVLLRAAIPHGAAARYARILAGHGFTVTFRGVAGGKLRVTWKSNGIVLATGTLRFSGNGQHKLHLMLTGAGRRLLRAHARHLLATIAFTPKGGRTLSFSERFSLR